MMAMCSKLLYFLYPRHHIRMGVSGNIAISSQLASSCGIFNNYHLTTTAMKLDLSAQLIHKWRELDANYHLKKNLSRVKVHSYRINRQMIITQNWGLHS